MPVGALVTVRGVVIAEAGRLGTPSLLVIADATGGLPVKLPDGTPGPARGVLVEITGTLADPYGQLEVRARAGGVVVVGQGTLSAPLVITAAMAGEATEGRLATITGTVSVSAEKSSSGDLVFALKDASESMLRVLADASAGLSSTAFRKGQRLVLTGIVGQRASKKGALDGYRLWLRDAGDVAAAPAAASSPTPAPSSTPPPTGSTTSSGTGQGGSQGTHVTSIALAKVAEDQVATVEGTITAGASLLDGSGRRIVVEDETGAVEVYLPAPNGGLTPGTRIRATGTVGRAWGAPRLRATALTVLGRASVVSHNLAVLPGPASEWRLVKVRGVVTAVHRDGDRWSADLKVGSDALLVIGLAGAAIPPTTIVEGHWATVTGVVRRPYPTATDRRYAIVPRGRGDVAPGGAAAGSASGTSSGSGGTSGATGASGNGASHTGAGATGPGAAGAHASGPPAGDVPAATIPDVELANLAAHAGEPVRVGGLVTTVVNEEIQLDDGTGTARLVLEGAAADQVALVAAGDALNATGTVDDRNGPVVVVTGAADIALLGDLGGDGSSAATADVPVADQGSAPDGMAAAGPSLETGARLAPAPLAAGTLALTACLAAAAVTWRWQRARKRTRARILERLAMVAAGRGGAPGGPETA